MSIAPALIPESNAGLDLMTSASPDLRLLLVSTAKVSSLEDDFKRSPDLIREAKLILPVALDRMKPGGEPAVAQVIEPQRVFFDKQFRNEREAKTFWANYVKVLASYPLAALQEAMTRHLAGPSGRFMPKPAELKELADEIMAPQVRALAVLRMGARSTPSVAVNRGTKEERLAALAEWDRQKAKLGGPSKAEK